MTFVVHKHYLCSITGKSYSEKDREMKRKPTKAKALSDNQGLVVSLVKRYLGKGLDFLDLVQAGNLGLLEALKRFDPNRGVKFTTYAYSWIIKMLQEAVYSTHIVRVPTNAQRIRNKVSEAKRLHYNQYGRNPSIAELAVLIKEKEEKIERFSFSGGIDYIDEGSSNKCDRIRSNSSPKRVRGNSSFSLRSANDDITENPHDIYMVDLKRQELRELICALPEQERMIMLLRIYEEKTLEEVGHKLKLTRERIRQIEKRIVGKLKKRAVA